MYTLALGMDHRRGALRNHSGIYLPPGTNQGWNVIKVMSPGVGQSPAGEGCISPSSSGHSGQRLRVGPSLEGSGAQGTRSCCAPRQPR